MKLKLGWFSFTCSGDNTVVFIELLGKKFEELSRVFDIVYCNYLMDKPTVPEMDVAFVEGAISTDQQLRKLKEIRAKTKILVAVGSCAVTGLPAGYRNTFPEWKKQLIRKRLKKWNLWEKVVPVPQLVKVDFQLAGCPVSEDQLYELLMRLKSAFTE